MHQAARRNCEARLPEGKLVALCADWRDEPFPRYAASVAPPSAGQDAGLPRLRGGAAGALKACA